MRNRWKPSWAGILLLSALGLPATAAGADPAPAAEVDGRRVIPEEARADLEAAAESYRAGDCAATLEALGRAEAAGARTGLLYYQQGYCHQAEGNGAKGVELKTRAIPYFERLIAQGEGGVDPYYYLAATYFQDLGDRAKGNELSVKAVEAHDAGTLGELGGESMFRLGRLIGFAMGALGDLQDPANLERARSLDARRVEAYERAAQLLSAEEVPNRVYLMLALNEAGASARKQGRLADAISYYGRVSRQDPRQKDAGYALFDIARKAAQSGDMETALAAWRAIRGPDEVKTPAQYGIKLVEKSMAFGELPEALGETAISSMDRTALESAAVEAAQVLIRAKTAEAAGDLGETPAGEEPPPTEEERRRSEGVFLATLQAMLQKGVDLRSFVLQHQLVPLLFR